MVRHVGALPDPRVPSYTALDVRVGWRVAAGAEVSVAAQNLLDAAHPESGAAPGRAEVPRSVYAQLRLSY
jgi:iron complex outermembrane receptor protein